jgi:DNA-binding ferritin-like protein
MKLNSLFPEDMISQSNTSLNLESVAGRLVYFHEQLHLLHWQTTSFSEHKALGKLYEYIQDFKDDLIEKMMGYTGKRPSVFKIEQLTNCTSLTCVTEIISFASELKKYGNINNFHDVENLADELSGRAAKTKYLLTLK